jgi:hypothetical protein
MLAVKVALGLGGLFFLTGLLSGIWKYYHMSTSEGGEAPTYVNIAHRAALLYSFACGLLAALIYFSVFSTTVNLIALVSMVVFFASAVIRYIQLGITGETDNQYRDEGVLLTVGMVLLILGEVGGFVVIFTGFLLSF